MLGNLRNMLGDDLKTKKTVFLGLTTKLEDSAFICHEASKCSQVIEIAAKLRNMLVAGDLDLTHKEKVRVLKMMNVAKVRALMQGTPYGFDTFNALDSISGDVVQLL